MVAVNSILWKDSLTTTREGASKNGPFTTNTPATILVGEKCRLGSYRLGSVQDNGLTDPRNTLSMVYYLFCSSTADVKTGDVASITLANSGEVVNYVVGDVRVYSNHIQAALTRSGTV